MVLVNVLRLNGFVLSTAIIGLRKPMSRAVIQFDSKSINCMQKCVGYVYKTPILPLLSPLKSYRLILEQTTAELQQNRLIASGHRRFLHIGHDTVDMVTILTEHVVENSRKDKGVVPTAPRKIEKSIKTNSTLPTTHWDVIHAGDYGMSITEDMVSTYEADDHEIVNWKWK